MEIILWVILDLRYNTHTEKLLLQLIFEREREWFLETLLNEANISDLLINGFNISYVLLYVMQECFGNTYWLLNVFVFLFVNLKERIFITFIVSLGYIKKINFCWIWDWIN